MIGTGRTSPATRSRRSTGSRRRALSAATGERRVRRPRPRGRRGAARRRSSSTAGRRWASIRRRCRGCRKRDALREAVTAIVDERRGCARRPRALDFGDGEPCWLPPGRRDRPRLVLERADDATPFDAPEDIARAARSRSSRGAPRRPAGRHASSSSLSDFLAPPPPRGWHDGVAPRLGRRAGRHPGPGLGTELPGRRRRGGADRGPAQRPRRLVRLSRRQARRRARANESTPRAAARRARVARARSRSCSARATRRRSTAPSSSGPRRRRSAGRAEARWGAAVAAVALSPRRCVLRVALGGGPAARRRHGAGCRARASLAHRRSQFGDARHGARRRSPRSRRGRVETLRVEHDLAPLTHARPPRSRRGTAATLQTVDVRQRVGRCLDDRASRGTGTSRIALRAGDRHGTRRRRRRTAGVADRCSVRAASRRPTSRGEPPLRRDTSPPAAVVPHRAGHACATRSTSLAVRRSPRRCRLATSQSTALSHGARGVRRR